MKVLGSHVTFVRRNSVAVETLRNSVAVEILRYIYIVMKV